MTSARILDALEELGVDVDGRTVLDVGCGFAFFLDEARQRGAIVHGLDVSERAIAWTRDHLGIPGTVGRVDRAPDGPFDIVRVSETIEHIPEPGPFVAELTRRMSTDSRLVIVTGRSDASLARRLGRWWWYLSPPDHCVIYSRQGLHEMLDAAGLEVVARRAFMFHWVGLDNALVKVARVLQQPRLRSLAARTPTLLVPIPHGTTQIVVARLRRTPSTAGSPAQAPVEVP
jgi:SAM-dependent methyltransferase